MKEKSTHTQDNDNKQINKKTWESLEKKKCEEGKMKKRGKE